MDDLVYYQVRLKDKSKNPHALALKTIRATRLPMITEWAAIHASINKARGKRIHLGTKVNRSPVRTLVTWLQESPVLSEWVKSDTCLVSPLGWPDEVLPAFKHRLIPTPYDIANVDMRYRYATGERAFANYLTVLLYCMGLSIEQIARGHDTSRASVLRAMYQGIESLNEVPQYLIWATATNFKKTPMPTILGKMPMRQRSRFIAALLSNPFLADTLYCRHLVQNSGYYSYLVYGTQKKLRLSKGCQIFRTREAHDGQ